MIRVFGLSVDDLAYLIAIVDDEKEEGERIKGLVQDRKSVV